MNSYTDSDYYSFQEQQRCTKGRQQAEIVGLWNMESGKLDQESYETYLNTLR